MKVIIIQCFESAKQILIEKCHILNKLAESRIKLEILNRQEIEELFFT